MSAGSIDNRVLSQQQLLSYMCAGDLMAFAFDAPDEVNTQCDVPFLGGISNNGKTLYIDRSYPYAKEDAAMLGAHERGEWWLVTQVKMNYDQAHMMANTLECMALESNRPGTTLKAYNARIDKFLGKIERKKLLKVPADLALYPYRSEPGLLRRLRAAQTVE